MKRIFLTLLSVALLLPAMAEQRTDAEMRSLAAEAISTAISQLSTDRYQLSTDNYQLSTKLKARPATSLKVLRDMEQLTLYGYTDGGWAIVSKDDAFDSILAYSDGPIDMSNPSPEFLWIISRYNAGMQEELRNGTASTRRAVRQKTCSVLKEVKPLLQTDWAQGWPYNAKCPVVQTDEGKKTSVCGCVATAFAQALYNLRLPQIAHGKKSYNWTSKDTGETKVLSYDFDKKPIDWANIVKSYSKDKSTDAQVEAISNFVYALGVLSHMGYSPSGSGASVTNTAKSINTFFGDLSVDVYSYKGSVIDVTVVARELNEGRPVVFSGCHEDEEGGHCFVIDGADREGLLHCNLGWGGSGNGYYTPDDMNGYPTHQALTILHPGNNVQVALPCEELANKGIKADGDHPVTTLEPNTWYMMYNEGRTVYACDLGKGKNVGVSVSLPDGGRSEYHAGSLVRLIPNAAGTRYALQTGLGNYFPTFAHDKKGKSGSSAVNYAIETITDKNGTPYDGHYYLLCPDETRLDCDGINVVGWESGSTHDVGGNASWQFFPVELSDVEPAEPVTSIEMAADTIRTVEGTQLTLNAEVLPATATIPFVSWATSKDAIATVDKGGNVKAVAKGIAEITAASVDGSGVKAVTTIMVGTVTHTQKLSSLMTSTVYMLQNFAGTGGYLVACDTVPGHPVLRGITSKSTSGCKDDNYWEDAVLGDNSTLWQVLKDDDGNYYLWSIGARKFLVNGEEEETEYVFSDTPKPFSIVAVEEGDFMDSANFVGHFYLNAGTTDRSRLMAATNFLNPAHWLDSTTAVRKRQTVWKIIATNGISKGLPIWTKDAFNKLITPDGIEASQLSTINSQLSTLYDLQGRALRSGALSGSSRNKGILIHNGQKLIR